MSKRRGWPWYATLGLVTIGTPALLFGWLGLIEALTLADDTEGNHITASFRRALDQYPELLILVLLVVVGLSLLIIGIVLGHVWNRWGKVRPRTKAWLILLLLAGPAAADTTMATPDLSVRTRNARGELVRSQARVRLFLRALGHKGDRVPAGYRVEHTVPLACGGADAPSNMALLTVDEWKAKIAWERKPCSAWFDGTNLRLLQHALDGCATGRTPKELCR